MTTPKYGIQWPAGTFTGDITDSKRLAEHYARQHFGAVYEIGSDADPETRMKRKIEEERECTRP